MDIIEKMFSKWNTKWPKYMSFDQHVYRYKNNTITSQSIWNEIISSPGKLQIRFDGFESGDGVIFLEDQVYYFEKGHQIKSEFKMNQALLLGFDVYNQVPSITRKKLETLGIDVSKSCEVKDTEDRIQLIFGTTDIEDKKSPQFWIDKERLYLTRVITDSGKNTDIRFQKYQTIYKVPVATQIVFFY